MEEKKQKKLDGIAQKASQLVKFLQEGVLKAVAKFIICDNQVGVVIILIVCVARCFNILQSLLMANKATFQNCLIAMRLKLTTADLPSTHDISTYIHNAFVKFLDELKGQIQVSNTNCCSVYHTSKYTTLGQDYWICLDNNKPLIHKLNKSIIYGHHSPLDPA